MLTQYNSVSLHRHITNTYKFDLFSSGFVAVLAAQQTEEAPTGSRAPPTPCARACVHLREHRRRRRAHPLRRPALPHGLPPHARDPPPPRGRRHRGRDPGARRADLGLRHPEGEPPGAHHPLRGEAQAGAPARRWSRRCPASAPAYLASMGIYLFGRDALEQSMADAALIDFGKDVIPRALPRDAGAGPPLPRLLGGRGDDPSYYEANLALTEAMPPFDFYEALAARLHAPALPARHQGRVVRGAPGPDLGGVASWWGPRSSGP